jgi:hypothetical protein
MCEWRKICTELESTQRASDAESTQYLAVEAIEGNPSIRGAQQVGINILRAAVDDFLRGEAWRAILCAAPRVST